MNYLVPSEIYPNLYISVGTLQSNRIAGFDLGWTLIRPIRSLHHRDEDDWRFLPNRLEILKKYWDRGYTIVIFTNQSGKHSHLRIILKMIHNVIYALRQDGINPWIFISTEDDQTFHKPSTGMWEIFQEYVSRPDTIHSFYVGDSAGRPYDSNDDDILFAKEIGLKFYEPEEIFPVNSLETLSDMIILVGMPNSGKEQYYFRSLSHSTHSTDHQIIKLMLELHEPVVINLTLGRYEERNQYISLAHQHDASVMILYFVRNGYGRNKNVEQLYTKDDYDEYFESLMEPSEGLDDVPVIEIDRII